MLIDSQKVSDNNKTSAKASQRFCIDFDVKERLVKFQLSICILRKSGEKKVQENICLIT